MALDHSFKALKQAEEKHRLGFYDDAAGKCRLAIEPFFDHEPAANHPESRKIPVPKKHWETKLGKATYDWLKARLARSKMRPTRRIIRRMSITASWIHK